MQPIGSAPVYDSALRSTGAISAIGDGPVTGPAIGAVMRRLSGPGPACVAEPTDIRTALKVLRAGGTIDLQGVSTAIHFDDAGSVPRDQLIPFALRDLSTREVDWNLSGQSSSITQESLAGVDTYT